MIVKQNVPFHFTCGQTYYDFNDFTYIPLMRYFHLHCDYKRLYQQWLEYIFHFVLYQDPFIEDDGSFPRNTEDLLKNLNRVCLEEHLPLCFYLVEEPLAPGPWLDTNARYCLFYGFRREYLEGLMRYLRGYRVVWGGIPDPAAPVAVRFAVDLINDICQYTSFLPNNMADVPSDPYSAFNSRVTPLLNRFPGLIRDLPKTGCDTKHPYLTSSVILDGVAENISFRQFQEDVCKRFSEAPFFPEVHAIASALDAASHIQGSGGATDTDAEAFIASEITSFRALLDKGRYASAHIENCLSIFSSVFTEYVPLYCRLYLYIS